MGREQRHLTTPTPLLLSPDAPKDFGAGRKCECGAKINRYAKKRKCDLCRQEQFNARVDEEIREIEEKRERARAKKTNGRRLGNLLDLRVQSGMSQEQLAEMIEVSVVYLDRLEKRIHGTPPEKCEKIAKILNVPVKELGY